MSKSKGNVVDPKVMIEKYGVDALRWYFYTVNDPGEPKRFDERDLFNKLRGFLGIFWNSFVFWDTYVDKMLNFRPTVVGRAKSPDQNGRGSLNQVGRQTPNKFRYKNVLDEWIMIKLDLLIREVTVRLDSYDITGAARLLEDFTINDFSQWYLRRSRRRFQHPESKEEMEQAAAVTTDVLLSLSVVSAPFVPFLAEAIFQGLRKKVNLKETSVHLVDWPGIKSKINPRVPSLGSRENQKSKIIGGMEIIRGIVAEALKQRAEAGIKVRQPLSKLQITNHKSQTHKELLKLIKEEVNVKEVSFGKELKLDTTLTPELKEEGLFREFVRNIQDMRRDLGLKPKNIISIQIQGNNEVEAALSRWSTLIKKDTNSKEVRIGGKKIFKAERELDFEGKQLWVGVS